MHVSSSQLLISILSGCGRFKEEGKGKHIHTKPKTGVSLWKRPCGKKRENIFRIFGWVQTGSGFYKKKAHILLWVSQLMHIDIG